MKWFIGLIIVILLFFLAATVLIPSQFKVSNIVLLNTNANSVYRYLKNEAMGEKFFGEKISKNSFKHGKEIFKINTRVMQSVEVLIKEKGSSVESLIEILPLRNDSSCIKWTADIKNGTNPFKKIKNYFIAKSLKNDMDGILENMKQFLEKKENIYGIYVMQTTVKDTLLITAKAIFKNYPSVQDVYNLIDTLKNYAKKNGAIQTDYPMLNVRTTDSINFEAMVGLPVNKIINNKGIIAYKGMPASGKLLATNEIKGGPNTISKAFNGLQAFLEDYKFISPAIPFQTIITDRLKEKDTTKWITKIYYPIY